MESLKLILSDRKYFAPAWVFASLNIMTGTWVLYLPHIKTHFGLNDSEVGIALFSLAFGLLISIPFIPFVNRKIGVGRSTAVGILLFALAFNLPLIAPNYVALCSCLFLVGIFSGFTDVSMNALVATIEKTNDKHIMSASHGFFSLGGFIGAGIGSLIMSEFLNPSGHMMLVSGCIIITNLFLSKYYYKVEEEAISKTKNQNKFKNIRPLLGVAIVAFIIMFNEGAVEHWSNLFLFDVVQVSENKAGLGFIAFSLCMTLGRFLGDGVSKKYGSIKVIMYGCAISIASYLLILTSTLYVSVLGFGILGLGLSVIIPELFRLAGRTKNIPASVSISFVSGVGFVGFLVGPVILGFISNISNLLTSYVFLAIMIVMSIALTYLKLKPASKS